MYLFGVEAAYTLEFTQRLLLSRKNTSSCKMGSKPSGAASKLYFA